MKKDKLNSAAQLTFINYLKQALTNGYPLSTSLKLLSEIWSGSSSQLVYTSKQVEESRQLEDVLHEVGFSNTLSVQIDMAAIDGNLLSCLNRLSELIRLENKQLKELRRELVYPTFLIGMMVTLLICMQAPSKTEILDNDWMSNLMLGGLMLLIIIGAFLISKMIMLLNKQDYCAPNKLTRIPITGLTLNSYIHYLIMPDLAVLLTNSFSLQKICQLTNQQPKNSLRRVLGAKVKDQLEKGIEIRAITESGAFISNNLIMFLETGTTGGQIGKRTLLLSKTPFYKLNLKLNSLIVNLQPLCFILIGICILGVYLKVLVPMYHLMEAM